VKLQGPFFSPHEATCGRSAGMSAARKRVFVVVVVVVGRTDGLAEAIALNVEVLCVVVVHLDSMIERWRAKNSQ